MQIIHKLWFVLTQSQRLSALKLLFLLLIATGFEALGIGIVVPAIGLLTPNAFSEKYPALLSFANQFGVHEHSQFVLLGMLALVAVYGIKTIFLAFVAWKQSNFVYGVHASISQRLFSGYLHQPYLFHVNKNSAILIRNTISNVSDLTNVLQQGLSWLAEILVILGIAVLLLAVEPLGATMVGVTLGSSAWLFNHVTKLRITRWGEARHEYDALRMQHLQQGLGGIKDVKLLGKEQLFLSQFQKYSDGTAHLRMRQQTLAALPRLWLEFLAVAGLAVLVSVMVLQGKQMESVIPTLALFAASAFRILPSLNKIIAATQTVRFSLPVINTLYDEFRLFWSDRKPQKYVETDEFNGDIIFDHVTFQYPETSTASLSEISLKIGKGSSIGIIGGSGAGKSTLVDIMLGLFTPTAGMVKVNGVDIGASLRQWQNKIGYVPQSIYLTDDTLRRNVAFGVPDHQIDDCVVWESLRAAHLDEFVNDFPDGLNTVVGERGVKLSGGQRQRIGIARALYHNPAVLVLDEATSALDTFTERSVIDAIRSLKGSKTIVIVAHRLSTVEHCDYIYRLEKGCIVEEGETFKVLEKYR